MGNFLEPTALYLNDGAGTFSDATATHLPGIVEEVRALGLMDLDADGDLDLAVAVGWSQGTRDRLYLNDGNGTFTDVTATHMPTVVRPSSCLDFGDVDGDGDIDIAVGNDLPRAFGSTNSLYVNDGAGRFAYSEMRYDLDNTASIKLVDADDDGDLDVFCADYDSYNKLYLNDGAGQFVDGTDRMPQGFENTRALAVGDIDGDGDADLVAGNYGARVTETVVYANHHRQLAATSLPFPGRNYTLDVASRAGYATVPQSAAVLIGTAPASIPLAPYGTLRIAPATMLPLGLIVLAAPDGRGTAVLPLPALSQLVGITLYAQAIVAPTTIAADARFTNVVAQRIHGD
ncbi:MAG: FG-GAP-like repeat-containing protein [Planctomycetota bacterium]